MKSRQASSDLIVAVLVRCPVGPAVCCETRPLAEEGTFRFLSAALARWR